MTVTVYLAVVTLAFVATQRSTRQEGVTTCTMSAEGRLPTPKISAVIFDLDGTLLDSETLSDKAMFAALPASAFEKQQKIESDIKCTPSTRLPWELKQKILGLRSSDWGPIVLQYANEKWGIPIDQLPSINQLASDWEHNLDKYCEQIQACYGAPELVEKIAAIGIPMGIATSSRQSSVEQKRKNHNQIFQHMATIVCGDHAAVSHGKPAPDIYLEAARQLGVKPHECLVFEDALSGVQSAKSAGCIVIAVPDSRFDSNQVAAFESEANAVLPDLWHFSGAEFGIEVDMTNIHGK